MSFGLKLKHQHHSGRLRPHEYTSYAPLCLLLIVVGVALTVCTVYAASPGPASGSIGLNGSMPGPAPTVAATITSPANQHHFSTSPVTISGTCPAKTLVEIYKNDIFAGSSICDNNGQYSFEIDLMLGQNVLVARVYNELNAPGPDSNSVTVFYDALPTQAGPLTPLNFGGAQLLLNTDAVFRGTFPGQELNVPIDIIGGTPPYAVNTQWGDSTNKIVPRNDNATFNVGHTYNKPGVFHLTLQATDATGRVAFLTVAAIVNGQPAGAATTAASGSSGAGKLVVLWPLYTSAVAVVVSFWLGERREKHVLGGSGPVYTPHAHA